VASEQRADPKPRDAAKQRPAAERRAAAAAARAATPLRFNHDAELPITARRESIMEALRAARY
jgi:hypothetical protein